MRYIKFLGNKEYPIPEKWNKKEETPKSDLLKVKDILNKTGYTLNQHLYGNGMEAWMEGTNKSGQVKAVLLCRLQIVNIAGIDSIYGNLLISSATLSNDITPSISNWRTISSTEEFIVENPLAFVGESIYLHPFVLVSFKFPNFIKSAYEQETLYAENLDKERAYIWPYENNKVYTFSAHNNNRKFIIDSVNSTEGTIHDSDLLIPKDIFYNVVNGIEGITIIS